MVHPTPLILVADADERAATELARWLLSQGFNAVAAASCLEAYAVIDAVRIDGLVGHLGLHDGSFFALAQALRSLRPAVVIGYADVEVQPPRELDACFVRPLDLGVLASFLSTRFGRRRSGEHVRLDPRRPVAPSTHAAQIGTRRNR